MRLFCLASSRTAIALLCARRSNAFATPVVRLASGHLEKHNKQNETEEDPWAHLPVIGHPKRASLNDHPIPQGSWQTNYDNQQRMYSMQLYASLAFLGGTLFYIWYADPFHIDKVLAPRKFMKNPPAFESPVLEPRFDAHLPPLEDRAVMRRNALVPEETALFKEATVPSSFAGTETQKTLAPVEKTQPLQATEVKSKPPATHAVPVVPDDAPDIPSHVPYLIVGGGTAAFAAFRAIRTNNPSAAVLVVTDEYYPPYMRPPLTKEMWFSDDTQKDNLKFRAMNGKERSLFFEHRDFFLEPRALPYTENGGLAVLKNTRVTGLDPNAQKVVLENGTEIHYDRCLLAPGASPRSLPAFDNASEELAERVTLYRGIDSFRDVNTAMKSAKRIAVIGGGFLGSEIASSLSRRGKDQGLEVVQIFPEKGCLSKILPEYLSDHLTQKMVSVDGVKVIPHNSVVSANLTAEGVNLKLKDNQQVVADHVVVAVGVTPNTDLAAGAGLEVDQEIGGYRVNAELQAEKNLWVAGDAASFFDVTLGRRRIEHHDHAVATGRTAGENMAGLGKSFNHQSMFWSDIGPEIGFEAVGLVDSSLETVAVFAKDSALPGSRDSPSLKGDASQEKVENFQLSSLKIPDASSDDYGRGVIFYLKDRIIVGVLLWNVFSHISTARKIVTAQKTFEDLSELSKLFILHEDEPETEKKNEKDTKEIPKTHLEGQTAVAAK
ncbi:hypothetical protein RvY_13205 [Ramazzottius varieornatus]|uniref:FAD/NAD(P)-binding domain-containing protein n=1 Tax=Ramazzottius varieornatus TaxID=947166 RepID=A0A1D1VVP5_RAMVA|nr:hypothetical protein RvY_13205 [Ramazzottius varieornatus]